MYPLASAARETARYPENSFSPIASPRRCGPTRSIFMMTVVDQQSPWLIPRRKLAAVIHPQVGAHIRIKGTGRPPIRRPPHPPPEAGGEDGDRNLGVVPPKTQARCGVRKAPGPAVFPRFSRCHS